VLISEKQQVINAEQEHEEKENPEPNVVSTERFTEHFFAPSIVIRVILPGTRVKHT
jgi:hypothetical protein